MLFINVFKKVNFRKGYGRETLVALARESPQFVRFSPQLRQIKL